MIVKRAKTGALIELIKDKIDVFGYRSDMVAEAIGALLRKSPSTTYVLVALDDEVPVAFLIAEAVVGTTQARLYQLWERPDSHVGLRRRLLDLFIRWLDEQRRDEVKIDVAISAVDEYTKLGFVETGASLSLDVVKVKQDEIVQDDGQDRATYGAAVAKQPSEIATDDKPDSAQAAA